MITTITDLRRLWPEWDFCKVSLGNSPVELVAERLRGERLVLSTMHWTGAAAAQALAEQLVAAGYEAKEKV